MFVIEKNVPIPNTCKTKPMSELAATLEKLQVGESFLVSGDKYSKTMRNNISNRAKKLGVKVVTRTVGEGMRVWRAA